MDPIIQGASHAAQQISQNPSPSPQQPGAEQAAPDADDQAKFEQAMQPVDAPPQQVGRIVISPDAAPPASQTVPSVGEASAAEPPTMGDTILDGMQHLRESHEGGMERLNQMLNSPDPVGTKDLVEMQLEMMKMGIEMEVTTKTSDKSSQDVQQLMRNQ